MNQLTCFVGAFLMCITTIAFSQAPINDIVSRRMVKERTMLPYPPIREADIFWEKRISRVIDVKQKQNLPFMYPAAPFFDLLKQGAENGDINIYRDATFTDPIDDTAGIFYNLDTVRLFDPETFIENFEVVRNEIFYEDVKKFRINEIWYFDEATSSMRVQIIGLSPIKMRTDENGLDLYEQPLFWVHFPSSREYLSRQLVANDFNDAAQVTWDDLFQMRLFASHITKQSNVRDNRLQDMYQGLTLLQESDKIKQELQNFEHDLWSY